jgi:hypothetical protein
MIETTLCFPQKYDSKNPLRTLLEVIQMKSRPGGHWISTTLTRTLNFWDVMLIMNLDL